MESRQSFVRVVLLAGVLGAGLCVPAFAGEPVGLSKSAESSTPQAEAAEASVALPSAAEGDTNIDVPEPASMLLLGTGLVGLAGIARRRLIDRRD